MTLRGVFARVSDALFPRGVACCACNRETVPDEQGLCPECAESIRRYIPSGSFCPEELDGYAAGLMYDGVTANAVKRFKYYGAAYLGDFFAQYMPVPPEWELDAIVPVPLHRIRQRVRGYNQSLLIAHALSKRTGIETRAELLVRTRHTRKQARLSREKRAKNLTGVFLSTADCTGLRIAIVDDVCTTGNTLNECAKALRAAGAKAVYGITACRVSRYD